MQPEPQIAETAFNLPELIIAIAAVASSLIAGVGACATIVAVIVAFFALLSARSAARIAWQAFSLEEKRGVEPCLIFTRHDPEEKSENWMIHNVGKGAALELLVLVDFDDRKESCKYTIECYPLAAGDIVELKLLEHRLEADKLAVTCEDITGRKFTSVCAGDTRTYKKGDEFSSCKPDRGWRITTDGKFVST